MPSAALRLVQRSLAPVAGTSAAALTPSGTAGTPLTSVELFVLIFLLAMSSLPKGLVMRATAPFAPRHQDRTVTSPRPSTSRQFRHNSSVFLANRPRRHTPPLSAQNLRD